MTSSSRLNIYGWKIAAVIAGLAAIILGTTLLYYIDPFNSILLPQCLFHQLTGLHCPGCGALRATHLLLHGNIPGAISSNPVLILFIYPFSTWFLLNLLNEKKFPMPLISARMVWVFAISIALFTILRNIPIAPFILLAP